MQETWVQSLGQEDPLKKEMATHSCILAWRTPWTEQPGGLQSMGSHRVRQDLARRVIMRNVLNKAQCLIAAAAAKSLQSCPTLCDPWTVAHRAPPSMGFSRQEYWSGSPFPSPGDLPDPGIEPGSPTLQADTLTSAPPGKLQANVI